MAGKSVLPRAEPASDRIRCMLQPELASFSLNTPISQLLSLAFELVLVRGVVRGLAVPLCYYALSAASSRHLRLPLYKCESMTSPAILQGRRPRPGQIIYRI